MKFTKIMIILILILSISVGCSTKQNNEEVSFNSWDDVVKQGSDAEVTILMWGGNESINMFMDGYVADNVKEKYGITLKRVPMNAPEFMSKLLNEKKGNVSEGTADLLWINGENFRTAKQGGLLWGPFTDILYNQQKFYDAGADDLINDTGVSIDGYEAIWGRAQLVLTYDSNITPNPPMNFADMMVWAKENPGLLTYPKLPDDFAGVSFIRTSYYELTGESDIFQKEMTKEEFFEVSQPVIEYFTEISPYLWREGRAYPATQAQMDELFKNGEIAVTMGFEIGKTSGMVKKGEYPDSVRTYVFDTGTIGNSHYLAVPYNSQNIAGALLVIDFLESPEAQIEKLKPVVWGDMPAFDVTKLDEKQKALLDAVETDPITLSIKELTDKRLPEMQAQYLDWIKEIWVSEIGGK